MYCTKCGNNLPENANYCSSCGTYMMPPNYYGNDSVNAASVYDTASNGKRFLNFLLDSLFTYLLFYALAFITAIILYALFDDISENTVMAISYLEAIIFWFLYYAIPEAIWGRTLAKWITGTKAEDYFGGKLSFGQALGRAACRFIPFETFSFLSKGNGWHDTITKTTVVDVRKFIH